MEATIRIEDRLSRRAIREFVGRESELRTLRALLENDDATVVQIHGISGIGKSALLRQFAETTRKSGSIVVELDGRDIEPTEAGFLEVLGSSIGGRIESVDAAAQRLTELNGPVLLSIDTYELLRLLDTWLRQSFLPSLPENTRVILAGREPPVSGWLTDPGWQGLFKSIRLDKLPEQKALELLEYLGIARTDAINLNEVTKGHPLALKLGADTFATSYDIDATSERIIADLTRIYLEKIDDVALRSAIEAVSIVRRVTYSMLGTLVPNLAPEDFYVRLKDLPFVDSKRDGLVIHDAVREVIAASLKSTNPLRYRSLRHDAWKQLNIELDTAPASDLWRYASDMLYLTENPVIREAFFPSDFQPYPVEPAQADHREAVLGIAALQDGEESAEKLSHWWEASTENFRVVKDHTGKIAGFYCCFPSELAPKSAVSNDPVVTPMYRHLLENPLPKGQRALILRKWLSKSHGEAPSGIQAACWLDVKRTYVEMRRQLRRVYTTAWDVQHYAPILPALGFSFFEDEIGLDDKIYRSAVLDFGPGLVHGWMSGIVGAELGLEPLDILDVHAHELIIEGERKKLTLLEFKVMQHLSDREKQAVSRDDMLEAVWGITYDGASNVVDVVIRSLRKKLGPYAGSIETVRGVGYRYFPP